MTAEADESQSPSSDEFLIADNASEACRDSHEYVTVPSRGQPLARVCLRCTAIEHLDAADEGGPTSPG